MFVGMSGSANFPSFADWDVAAIGFGTAVVIEFALRAFNRNEAAEDEPIASATLTRLTPRGDAQPVSEHFWEEPAIETMTVVGRALVLALAVMGLTLAAKILTAHPVQHAAGPGMNARSACATQRFCVLQRVEALADRRVIPPAN